MRLRYRYRLEPNAEQRTALTRAFGCGRVVFNDGLHLREEARATGQPYVPDGDGQRRVVKIDRFAPTSQTCSTCGLVDGPKPLSVREWACGDCGTTDDRDVNATKNIMAIGQRDVRNVSGAGESLRFGVAAGVEGGTSDG